MPRFEYASLRPLDLRLLELHPGLAGDVLAGTITHKYFSVEGDEIPQFKALSYHWGDQSDPVSISLSTCQSLEDPSSDVESGSLDIGRNLALVLQALRRQDKRRVLWCDSICINQRDLPERAAQVQCMKDIYRYAKSVVVWLGPEASWSTMAMETVRWAGEQIESATMDYIHGKHVFTCRVTADKRILKTADPLPLGGAQWLAIEKLVALDWHKRLWTFQEIILANQKACIVKLGKEEMSWAVYKDSLSFILFGKPLPHDCFLDETSFSLNADMMASKALGCVEVKGKNNWIEMIGVSREYECSNPRDRIYALQGLVAPYLALAITPDYTKSAKDVLISICLQHIETQKNLEFLHHCNAAARPSWVADLDRPLSSLVIDCHVAPFSTPSAYLIEPGVLETGGISCDELDCDPILLPQKVISQTDIEYRQQFVDMVNAFTSHNSHQDDNHLDRLTMALTYGAVRDYSLQKLRVLNEMSFHSLQDWRWKIRRWLNGTSDAVEDLEDFRLND
ncbi:uncharacterized protein FIESC28_02723 [Fusarium coffeatum]|uniref:Heterokaryon incompatibility domain-containing protein n=1 Tax=Fusarium coffeatum TaxID=231269 RepID=A0A366S5A8_9HYPO|nr:uncharacterized protein FIESC28_02723 [Fusarium coffeatum]RBR24527.1 hypothetical protein FIESC28_02723 [Fusarium coffeatum]